MILIVGVKRYFKVYFVIKYVLLRTDGRRFLYLILFSATIAHEYTLVSFGGHGVRVANLFSFCVVLLCVFTFRVPRCDVLFPLFVFACV